MDTCLPNGAVRSAFTDRTLRPLQGFAPRPAAAPRPAPRPVGAGGAGGGASGSFSAPLIENFTRSPAFVSVCTWLSRISTGRLNHFVASRLATKSESDGSEAAKPLIVKSVPTCLSSVSHSRSGRLRLISSSTCTGADCPRRSCSMRVTRCVSWALRASNFCTCASTDRSLTVSVSAAGNVPIELRRLLAERQEPPADAEDRGNEDEARANRDAVRRRDEDPGRFLRSRALDGEQVDANHRSPARRSAKPDRDRSRRRHLGRVHAEFRRRRTRPA